MKRGVIWVLAAAGCLGDVEVPPDPPEVSSVESPTAVATQVLEGRKGKGTSVRIDGEIVVPHDAEETWSHSVDLVPGENVFELSSTRESGLESREVTVVTIVYEPPCPQAPGVDAYPEVTTERAVSLSGARPAATSLLVDGVEIVPLGDEREWTYTLLLPDEDGTYMYTFTARDAKMRDSDPETVQIVLDRTPPAITARYPQPSDTGVPTSALVSVSFDGPLAFAGGDPMPETIVVRRNGAPVPGFVAFSVLAHTLEWFPTTGALAPSASYEVSVVPSLVTDHAGNAGDPAAPFGWQWTFTTTVAPDTTPPPAPTLDAPPETTMAPSVTLTGTKAPWTSIFVNGRKVVGVNPETTWTWEMPLPVGTSSAGIAARSVSDVETLLLPAARIERVQTKPMPPTVDGAVPTEVTMPRVPLRGGRPPDTSILLDDVPVVCRAADTTWAFTAPLVPGVNDLRLQARDGEGNLSDPTIFSVNYDQAYDGPVPRDFVLQVELELRDLSQISGVREEFVTGSNNYGIDVWVEGPIEPGETCVLTNGERQNIEYVATIEHYIGTKAQHKVPFADDDYRGTDYLAAMISGGVFAFRGLDATSQRREGNGRELAGLLAGLTEQDLRQNVDCFGSPLVDACTRPTAKDGRYRVLPWTPRRRNGNGLLDQGDYLLHIMINLDRDGSWLSANDFETCWGDPAYENVGMHRVVTRIALGSEPYELQIPQSEEFSGPDREGSEKLYFISEEGIRVTWGPQGG